MHTMLLKNCGSWSNIGMNGNTGTGNLNSSSSSRPTNNNNHHHPNGSDGDSIISVQRSIFEKVDFFLPSSNNLFRKKQKQQETPSSTLSKFNNNNHRNNNNNNKKSPHRVLMTHEEANNKCIAEELGKMSLKDQTEMLRVVQYAKADVDGTQQIFHDLNQLSLEEREMVLHDIHGISENPQESQQLIENALEEMTVEIQKYVLQQQQQERQQQLQRSRNNNNNSNTTTMNNSSFTSSSTTTTPSNTTIAYCMAKAISQDYVHDRQRRLVFLRAEQMNVGRAAMRFVDFWEQKLLLFGPDKLCCDIALSDLTAQDLEFLSQGSFQLLPTRDRAGRAVLVHLPVFMKCKAHENMLRTIYYILMSALEDEETQKKGVIFVFSRFGPTRPAPDPKLTQKSLTLFSTLPIRICGWHYCTHDKLFTILFPLVAKRFEKQARVRLRVHHGSHVECSYTLMTFGIPVGGFPITDDLQDLKRQKHSRWIATRRNLELKRKTNKQRLLLLHQQQQQQQHLLLQSSSSLSSSDINGDGFKNSSHSTTLTSTGAAANTTTNSMPVIGGTLLPSHSDILFGRGKPVQEHPGNLSLGVLVESLLSQYSQCKGKKQKMDLTQGVVVSIKKRGGRFVKQVDGLWVEVDDETARSKVSHTFRNKKMELVQRQQQQQKDSGSAKRSHATA